MLGYSLEIPKKGSANGQVLAKAIAQLLPSALFQDLKLHANTKWNVPVLVVLSLFWVWSENPTLTGAFETVREQCRLILGLTYTLTYQGFINALMTWTPVLMPLIVSQLQHLMETIGGEHYRINGWVPLGVDGSRFQVPYTQPNENAYSSKPSETNKSQEKAKSPKPTENAEADEEKPKEKKPTLWMTMIYHLKLRMPWVWMTGPSGSSERGHFLQIARETVFPRKTLFCGDAGFVGYGLWNGLAEMGHSFLFRVGSNVKLFFEENAVVDEQSRLVYYWPKGQAKVGEPPLVLRLVQVKVGKKQIWLVTNVLDEKELSIETCRKMYMLRWGIEEHFRTIKQTYGRRELKSRTPESVELELTWSLLGLWVVQLMASKSQLDRDVLPEQSSAAASLKVVRDMLALWCVTPEENNSLDNRMERAVVTRYKSKNKEARHKPVKRKKDRPSAGPPVLSGLNEMRNDTEYQGALKKMEELMERDAKLKSKYEKILGAMFGNVNGGVKMAKAA